MNGLNKSFSARELDGSGDKLNDIHQSSESIEFPPDPKSSIEKNQTLDPYNDSHITIEDKGRENKNIKN